MNSLIRQTKVLALALLVLALTPFAANADSIDPVSFSDTLGIGESVTVRKTVTVSEGATSSRLDVHFLFDTSGSMGSAINAAKTAASDIMTALGGFSTDLAGSVGVFSEAASLVLPVPGAVINQALTTNVGTVTAAINAVTLGNPDGGGDFPERGQDAVALVADNLAWRPGSKRVIVAFGDASWKNDLTTDAAAIAALDAANASLIGLRFSDFDFADADSDDTNFTQSVEDLGGSVFDGGALPADIVDAITAGLTDSFLNYGTVSVDDLGNGLPEIGVSSICVSAGIGACVGADAVGDYDRSIERAFEFDVTFTRLAAGDTTFDTYGLVDGAIVAREVDTFGGGVSVPEPAPLALLAMSLLGLAFLRRRKVATTA